LRVLLNHVSPFFPKKIKSFLPKLFFFLNRSSDCLLEIAALLGRRATRRRLSKGQPRSLWGVTPILTLPIKARCDRLLGLESDSLVLTTYYVSSSFDVNLSSFTNFVSKFSANMLYVWCKLVLAWALLRYDIFHYFYDRGILIPEAPTEPDQKLKIGINEQELRLLDKADKRLYCYTYGADVRSRKTTQALGKYNCCMDCPKPGRYCICSETGSKKNIDRIRPYARALLATTDNIKDVEGARVFHYWAIDLEKVPYVGVTRKDGPLTVAHAPNHAIFKGTRYLEAAVDQLKAEGMDIELRMLTGVSNEKVLEVFGEADIIADQFITGGYGYTLIEGLARGKPVLCFIRDLNWIAEPGQCPVIRTDPDRLLETLRWCLENRHKLPEIGLKGRRYVERFYSIAPVAARLGHLYLETADFPEMTKRLLCQKIEKSLSSN
jgi:glycosyltransferase involved in cell wall biosynthesis